MPCLKINTNLLSNQVPKDFVKNILPILSQTVKKPVERFIVSVSTGCMQSINGDDAAPSVVASLESIGNLGPRENKVIAKEVTGYIESTLGVDKDRVFLTFYDLQASDVAKSGLLAG